MFKKITLLILFSGFLGYSQIGVGTVMPYSTLDITALNETGASTAVDGILIPRVDRERALNMTGIVTSTLIYVNNIATGSATLKAINITSTGFYYFDGTVWQKLATNVSTEWGLSGNNGTTPATNFIGTIDNVDFVTKTNNAEAMRVTSTGNIGINAPTPSATDRVNIITGTAMNGLLLTSQQTAAGSYGFRNNATLATGNANIYTGYNGTIALAGGPVTNTGLYSEVPNGSSPAMVASATGSNTYTASLANSTVWNAFNGTTSYNTAAGVVGINSAASGTALGLGVYGTTIQRNGSGIYGSNTGPAGTSFGYLFGFSRTSTYGDGTATGAYSFGVFGDGGTTRRSGGVFGDNWGNSRGALGYFTSGGANAAVYGFGTAYTAGAAAGRLASSGNGNQEPNNMIGLGIYGGVMGGWVRGMHYGLHSKGKEYGMYVDGKTITNEPVIQLINNGEDKRTVSFAPASLSADVYVRGNSKLSNGSVYIAFNEKFSNVISDKIPLNITVTPTGESKGVFVTEVTSKGFKIVENANGNGNITINWVAYGTRKGYENPNEILSDEISSSEFDTNMDAVMYNDNNTDGTQKGIWYDGKKVQTGSMPDSFEKEKLATKKTKKTPSTSYSKSDKE